MSFLGLSPDLGNLTAEQGFSSLVTRHYAGLMQKGDPRDPLLLQVLPAPEESLEVEGFVDDPVGDIRATQVEGVLQKYHGRVLVMPTGACAIHCRHCFRRSFPYQELKNVGLPGRLAAFLAKSPEVREVIFSGGDPLMLDDASFGELLAVIQGAKNVERFRIHTRLPLVLPSRFSAELIQMLGGCGRPCVLVVQANHANELSPESAEVFAELRAQGVHLLNQSVLLRGINDSPEVQAELSLKLFQQGVLPYYLHQLDRARGTAHFEVPVQKGLEILRGLSAILPGYLVPKYVQEVPGATGKTPLA